MSASAIATAPDLMDFGVVPNVVPLQMNKYGASGMMIGLITGTA